MKRLILNIVFMLSFASANSQVYTLLHYGVAPYLEKADYSAIPINETTTITITGGNFDYNTEFDFGVNVSVDNINILSDHIAEVTVTTGATIETIEIEAYNGYNENFGDITIEAKVLTVLIPGDGTTIWENITANVNVGLGYIETEGTNTGWTESATFGEVPVSTNCELSFTYAGVGSNGSSTQYGMFGLNHGTVGASASYTDIDYAIYIQASNNLMVYENGANKGAFGTVAVGDILSIKRIAGVITYYKNGVQFYESATTSTFALHYDCSLYRNIKVDNIKITY